MSFTKALVTKLASNNPKFLGLYRKVCNPSGPEWANMLRPQFRAMGQHCSIIYDTYIDTPSLVSLGDNVRLASCTILTHDGVINMLERAYGDRLDAVSPVSIGNNVFVGRSATILRGVTIGDNVVVAAGSVVSRDLESGYVYGGVPAKKICTIEELRERLKKESEALPWYPLICSRKPGGYDPEMEPTLQAMRAEYFHPKG